MSTFSTSAEHPSAQALGEAHKLKTFRVWYCDTRNYFFDVQARDDDAAEEAAEALLDEGHHGTDGDGEYEVHFSTEEVQP